MAALLAAAAFGQNNPQPWSEQPPLAQAQGPDYGQPGYGPPAPGGPYQSGPNDSADRGVARVSFMSGNVSVRRGDSGDLVAAVMNAPLTVGDRLVTADGARAEVELDYSNIVRLGPSTEVRFSLLSARAYQVQIAVGTTVFRVLRDTDARIEISTPTVAIHPLRTGIYRVTVHQDGSSDITVRGGGDAEIGSPAGTQPLHNGEMMMTRGSSDDPEFQVVAPQPDDDLDRWSASRDRQMQSARSPQYVNRGMYGTEDMDQYGRWQSDPQYGNVWVPNEGPGWAPYQCGRWVWMDYYGWTWLGCEPWAWAPYHYGRWFYGGAGWAWWPGPVIAPAFWSPALVGFFGFGAPGFGVGFGFGFGSVGWVPLAPYERFYPWYGAGLYGRFGGVNVVGGVNVAALYRNARVTSGVTAMRAGDFGRAGVTSTNLVRPTSQELARAGAVRGQLPVGPSRESTNFSSRAANTAGLPRTSDNMHFSGRTASVNRVSFAEQQRSFNQAAARGFSGSGAGYRGAGAGAGRSVSPGQSGGAWQRFNPGARSPGMGPGMGSRAGAPPGGSYRGGQSAPRTSPQQPVRINPPIVQGRGSAPGRSMPRGGGSHGGGGGRH